MTYRLRLVVNELPFVYLYLHASSTVLAVDQGDIRAPAGWIAVAAGVLGLGKFYGGGNPACPPLLHGGALATGRGKK